MLKKSSLYKSSTKKQTVTIYSQSGFPSLNNSSTSSSSSVSSFSSVKCHNLTLYLVILLLPSTYLILNSLLPEQNTWFTFKTNYIDNRELITFQIITERNLTIHQTTSSKLSKSQINLNTSSLKSEGCKIPKLDPFDKSIMKFIRTPSEINCTDKFSFLFDSLLNSQIRPLSAQIRQAGYSTCCYRTIHRRKEKKNKHPDSTYQTSKDCYPLSIDNVTTITNPTHEFLAIICEPLKNSTNHSANTIEKPIVKNVGNSTKKKKEKEPTDKHENVVDMHIAVPLKPEVEKRVNEYYKKVKNGSTNLKESDKVNVVILGLDAMSRMNFLRQMPSVHDYLVNNLSAVGMEAVNKIGVNTMPNVGAVLTSLNASQLQICSKRDAFDKCPFVWNDYASQGYRTSFGEDTTWMGIFNYLRRGFLKIPTDYYLRPYDVAANDFIGTHIQDGARLCQGPRLTLNVLLDYMKKMAVTMAHSKRYFQLVWSTGLSHSYLNDPKLSEKPVLSFLQWFKDNDYFNETIFILMSDHGIRWGPIFDKPQGQLEVRLPFLYFVIPPWFEHKYGRAVRNLKRNRERLTTPFDLHQTLKDLLDLSRIGNRQLVKREKKLNKILSNWLSIKLALPQGISQFLPLPKSRTCEMAGIEEHYCTCHESKVLEGDLEKDNLLQQVANFVVYSLNLMVSKKSECAYLALHKVKRATTIGPKFDSRKAYQLVLETRPGGAVFEATVERKGIKKENVYSWKLSGEISRINKYGNQSHCVDWFYLKPYCYCLDLLDEKT